MIVTLYVIECCLDQKWFLYQMSTNYLSSIYFPRLWKNENVKTGLIKHD